MLLLSVIHAESGALELNLGCRGCNVVLINLDFLRSDYMGVTGDRDMTPNIDRYFDKAIIFDNAYATAGSTYRGNLSVFTATDPHYYAIDVLTYTHLAAKNLGPWRQVFLARTSFAEILAAHGYHTVGINKGKRSGRATLLDRGYREYRDFPLRTLIQDLIPPIVERTANLTRPTLLHLHAVPTRLHNAFYPVDRPRNLNQDIIYKPYQRAGEPYGYYIYRDYTVGDRRMRRAEHDIYQQQLKYADDMLEGLFEVLDTIASESLIVLFSTHGTQIGDKGIYASDGTGYESNIRVPLMIRHPSVRKTLRVSQRVSMLDLTPTLLEMLEIEGPASDGRSLLPTILGAPYPRQYIWGKNDKDDFVISGKWKLLRRSKFERKLYRLDDPARLNIYRENRGIARRLEFIDNPGVTRTRTLRDQVHELQVIETRQTLLFDLDRDPEETTDLATKHPELTSQLNTILEERQQRASNSIQEVLKP